MPANHTIKKFSRTISGVTPVAVMTMPIRCPGECVFCPTYAEAPKSYTPESPAVLRAKSCDYDAAKQVELRLKILSEMGHPADKIELIVMGGTFLSYPEEYQYSFIKSCYDAMNGWLSASLDEAKQINETALHRCVGLCIETRPDWCGEREMQRMLEFGTTRVELGVQTLDDDIYNLVRRGHKVNDVIKATRLLKNHGIKVYYHWMPGLPGSSIVRDLELSSKMFNETDFRPDGLKLYPTLVVSETELEKWYLAGKYTPYSMEAMVDLLIDIKKMVPKYVRIPRVMRDIPSKFIVAGCKDLALRSSVQLSMKTKNVQCQCIRCREYGHRTRDGWLIGEPGLHRFDYDASGGKEIFLSFEDNQATLFGLLRLRIDISGEDVYPAMVREIHVFGTEVPIGEQNRLAAQHKGLGTQLLKEAERIACEEFAIGKIAVISGVGARSYFRTEFGYSLEGQYMVKSLKQDA
ncbi:MAG: tRNA uridine(34) 5-carboxymethylaminomethyl modification radical SAM/GNAT enzyme Elp3 [Dehalococcoidia bacterium]|nr:tRNA uridine(34) 5-carboxymethylaminomethyl modification radical SAM/GNAT enzyme Elp3 [Dehalococcoidia bacterium]MDD5494446.1 tRNA uridine(34) 5-carboxymethylaminomethyl modification radical SAM/GNAT enzyme Elp3 [Dehalococcoidia bacterium]